jgi:polar amino acid transport system substrate-binding protein
MAKEKGFYAAAGLTVDIIPYTVGSQSVVENVVTNEAQYGTGRSSLIADRVNGKPVVLLAAIFQDTPSILLTLADRGIETPSDLVGRKIMINSDGLVEAGIMGMLWAENVRIHDVIHQRQSYNINDLINGVTDAMHCYISNEPYILQQRKIGFHVFLPKDFGQNYYGDFYSPLSEKQDTILIG